MKIEKKKFRLQYPSYNNDSGCLVCGDTEYIEADAIEINAGLICFLRNSPDNYDQYIFAVRQNCSVTELI